MNVERISICGKNKSFANDGLTHVSEMNVRKTNERDLFVKSNRNLSFGENGAITCTGVIGGMAGGAAVAGKCMVIGTALGGPVGGTVGAVVGGIAVVAGTLGGFLAGFAAEEIVDDFKKS